LKREFRCILHEFQDRKKERKKEENQDIFAGFLAFGNVKRICKMNATGKYLLCIENCGQLREVIFN
jgi:hypothetical protein